MLSKETKPNNVVVFESADGRIFWTPLTSRDDKAISERESQGDRVLRITTEAEAKRLADIRSQINSHSRLKGGKPYED
jgi:sugar lactone lactonase YvrE